MRSRQRSLRSLVAAVVVFGIGAIALPATPAAAGTPQAGFQEQIVFSGLTQPTNIEFSPDGRVFVAEKRGTIQVFDNLADTTPTLFADLSSQVHNQWDRGMLGMTLAPNFPTDPWVYVLYTYDAPPGETAPYWDDSCGSDANDGHCIVQGRLSRLQASGDTMTGSEQVLITDWCQQFPSHSIGDLQFGADGALYVTAGDGASFSHTDYGQVVPGYNPCSDPTNEGGALRVQDVRTTSDPTALNGALLRLNPATGAAATGNPNTTGDANAKRIVAYGLRNPFRLTMRPGTSEPWISETGWNDWEEVNRVASPTAGVTNFGWPCYEGVNKQGAYDSANIPLCESLYAGTAPTAPYFTWSHASKVVSGETCPTGSSSSTGVAFYPGSGPYPARYQGAVFFADYSRNCIWAMKTTATSGGLPSTGSIETFLAGAANPVDLEMGPGDELYYVDVSGGTVRRLRYFDGNQPPSAAISANPTGGGVPLTVNFDGSASTDPDPADQDRLTYAWDFSSDGTTDSTAKTPTWTYTTAGNKIARLTVTDSLGASNSATMTITVGTTAPTATIDTPVTGTTWAVGDTINFSGHATDPQDGDLPAAALTWHLRMQHCSSPSVCHTHFLQDFTGAGGSFVAPDHEYPSYLELELVATDSSNLTHSVVRRLDPKTVNLTFASNTPGLNASVGSFTGPTPFTRTVIQHSSTTISAPTPQVVDSTAFTFGTWSDGGAQTHIITAPATATTYTANYNSAPLVNLALNKPTTSSTPCAATETSAKAVNGTWNGGLSDKFCSLITGAKWMQVDLGSVSSLMSITVHHAGDGGETTAWNTKDFNIQVSNDAATWTTVATVTGNTASATTHQVSVNARYVKLNVVTPTSNGEPAARIFELEVRGTTGATPPPPPPPPPPGNTTNLALNHPATASAECASTESAAKAVNGTVNGGLSDKWCSEGTGTQWLRVDLGADASITQFVVRHSGAGGESTAWNTSDFTIETSSNGTTWTNVVTVTNNTASVTTHNVTATGRYVRLNVTKPTSDGNIATRIYEFEVMGTGGTAPPPPPVTPTNLALNKAATASSSCATTEGPAKAVNGSWTGGFSDKWCSLTAAKWMQVDLGAVANLTSFVVRHAAAGGEQASWNTKDFNIQVSNDGTTWTTVTTVTGNTANITTHNVTVSGRYVRLNVITPTSDGNVAARIYELEAIGTLA